MVPRYAMWLTHAADTFTISNIGQALELSQEEFNSCREVLAQGKVSIPQAIRAIRAEARKQKEPGKPEAGRALTWQYVPCLPNLFWPLLCTNHCGLLLTQFPQLAPRRLPPPWWSGGVTSRRDQRVNGVPHLPRGCLSNRPWRQLRLPGLRH